MRVNVVAVQPKMELADYASFESFAARMATLLERACASTDPALPSLIVLPEYLGMYLSFVPQHWEEVCDQAKMTGAIARILEGAGASARDRMAAKRLLFVDHALETYRAYLDLFSALAKKHEVYLVAGSLCLPAIGESPHRGGAFVESDDRVFNESYLFSPTGRCLNRTSKVHIPPGEDVLLDGAPIERMVPSASAIGRIGTAMCWDGYHDRCIERFDSLGTQILVQPAYFAGPEVRFDGSGLMVPRPWDFVSLIQGRESLQFGVGSFLVGAVFEDQRAEGMSFIAKNTGRVDAPLEDAVVARTEDPYAEAFVDAVVDLELSSAGIPSS